MLNAASSGQDLYATVAARAFHTTFEDCLEHFPKDTPIVNENNSWRYATEDEIVNGSYDKLADGETDTYDEGKERRKKAKVILLGLMYGMNSKTIAEMLGCSMEEAEGIMSSVFDAFPKIKELIAERQNFARKHKYTSTIWGRKRRLPDIALPLYEFDFNGCPDAIKNDIEWQEENKRKWTQQLQSLKYRDRIKKKEELEKKFGIKIYFNQEKISKAERQVLNSIIQGCLVYDTLIHTKEYGIVKIGDVVGQHLHIWDGKEWSDCDITYSGKKQLVKLKTSRSNINCSPNHKFNVILANGNKHFRESSKLKIKDRLEINQTYTKSESSYVSNRRFDSTVHNAHNYYISDINNSFKMGEFLGRLASDGSISYDCSRSNIRLFFAEHEFDEIDYFRDMLSMWDTKIKVEEQPRKDRNMRMAQINIYSLSLTKELNYLDTRHRIPDEMWRDTEMLRGYIRGLFDGDGTVTSSGISLHYGKNYDYSSLFSDLQKALLFFGIRSSWQCLNDKSYILRVSMYDIHKFANVIGFISKTKQERAEKLPLTKKDEHCFGPNALIKDIQVTEEYVDMYDVCNTKNGYFIANGIVTHNSAADMSKKALIAIHQNQELKDLGLQMLVPIHDEILVQCPLANAKRCKELFTYEMENCAKDKISLDIKVDPACSFAWYGDEISIE